MTRPHWDLMRTVYSDEEAPDCPEDTSDEEEEFQPHKRKKKCSDFNSDFKFESDPDEYNKDTWKELSKYIKCKAKRKLDAKIQRIRKKKQVHDVCHQPWNDLSKYIRGKINTKLDDEIQKIRKEKEAKVNPIKVELETDQNDDDDEIFSLPEDEMKKDIIRTKEKKGKKKNPAEEKDEETGKLEEYTDSRTIPKYTSFREFHTPISLLKALNQMNFEQPTAIQAATIPYALANQDIFACAATGTGKTVAYMLPILHRLIYKPMESSTVTRVVVLVPTRELGVQVYKVTRELAQFTSTEVGLSVGGLDVKVQAKVLRKKPDIVIATPGRLIDHMRDLPTFSLDRIEVLVLDEADRMLDEHFVDQMKEIVRRCPKCRQTMLFSATMTEEVDDLIAVSLKNPKKIFLDSNEAVAVNLRQEFVRVREKREGDREAILAALVYRTFHTRTLVFVQTKKQAHKLHIILGLLGIKVGELHGNLTQPQRLENLRRFEDEEIDVLVATDVAARGIDICGVKAVINFTMPATLQQYIHRVGRTARAGRGGIAISLAGEKERSLVKKVQKGARNPSKKRIISSDVIQKFINKLQSLESDVERILLKEQNEKEITKLENQANCAQRFLKAKDKDKDKNQRSLSQTNNERKQERDNFQVIKKQVGKNHKREKEPSNMVQKKKKRQKEPKRDPAEERAQRELDRLIAYQVRVTKRKIKPKKIRAYKEDWVSVKKGSLKRSRSSFDVDLTDTSRKNVKRMRYEANAKIKGSARKMEQKHKFTARKNQRKRR